MNQGGSGAGNMSNAGNQNMGSGGNQANNMSGSSGGSMNQGSGSGKSSFGSGNTGSGAGSGNMGKEKRATMSSSSGESEDDMSGEYDNAPDLDEADMEENDLTDDGADNIEWDDQDSPNK